MGGDKATVYEAFYAGREAGKVAKTWGDEFDQVVIRTPYYQVLEAVGYIRRLPSMDIETFTNALEVWIGGFSQAIGIDYGWVWDERD